MGVKFAHKVILCRVRIGVRRGFLLPRCGQLLLAHRSLLHGVLLTLGDKIQDGLQMEKPRPLYLSGFTDADAAEVALARAFVKFGARKSAMMLNAVFWRAYPDGQAVGLVVK